MISNRVERLRALTLVTLATLAAVVALPAPAQANAFGCQVINGFGFTFGGQNLRAPKGFLCHRIRGRGRLITQEDAAYTANLGSLYGMLTGRVCNWRIDFYYHRDSDGRVYRADRGSTHHGCSAVVWRSVKRNKRLAHFGTACAALYVNGVWRNRQCHNITR